MLDMLKRLGITSEAELIARLGLLETASSEGGSVGPITPDDAITALTWRHAQPDSAGYRSGKEFRAL